MINRIRALHEHIPDLGIGGDVRAGEGFAADGYGAQGGGVEDLPRAAEGLDREIHVPGVAEQVGVHDRVERCVGAVERDVAAAEGRDEHDYYRGVVLTVEGRVEEEVV